MWFPIFSVHLSRFVLTNDAGETRPETYVSGFVAQARADTLNRRPF